MKLAIVSDAIVDRSHGTGNLLLRLLESAPVTATSFHPGLAAPRPELQSFSVKGRPTAAAQVDSLRHKVRALRRLVPARPPSARRHRFSLNDGARASLAASDLVLAVVHTRDGLDLVEDCLAGLDASTPVVMWFMDLLIGTDEAGSRRLPAGARVWALNSRIKAGLEQLFPAAMPVEERMFVGVHMPPAPSRAARPLSAAMRCVMIGNVWDTSVLPVLNAVWTEACARLGLDLVIHWFAPAQAHARLAEAGRAPGGAIRYEGHAADLDAVLSEADLAIMAFSGTSADASLYRNYSFPSRVADFAANGLPVFAICGADTALADYLAASGAGIYDAAVSVARAAESCARFLSDIAARQACSTRARQYAEAHFDLGHQRQLFVAELRASVARGDRVAMLRLS